MIYQELACIDGMAINQGGRDVPLKHGKRALGGIFETERSENQKVMWLTQLRIFKRNMYSMMYQGLAPVGDMAIDREVDMFSQNMKNAP